MFCEHTNIKDGFVICLKHSSKSGPRVVDVEIDAEHLWYHKRYFGTRKLYFVDLMKCSKIYEQIQVQLTFRCKRIITFICKTSDHMEQLFNVFSAHI